jgi:hypothetical protein
MMNGRNKEANFREQSIPEKLSSSAGKYFT